MSISEEIKAFRKIVRDLIAIEIEDEASSCLLAPRALCATAIHALKGGSYLTDSDILLLNREFLSVLDERNITISSRDRNYFLGKKLARKKTASWITDEVKKGAWAHQMRQPRDTY